MNDTPTTKPRRRVAAVVGVLASVVLLVAVSTRMSAGAEEASVPTTPVSTVPDSVSTSIETTTTEPGPVTTAPPVTEPGPPVAPHGTPPTTGAAGIMVLDGENNAPGALTVKVFEDLNGNGFQDRDETVLVADAPVSVLRESDGLRDGPRPTDATGAVSFAELAPGTWMVRASRTADKPVVTSTIVIAPQGAHTVRIGLAPLVGPIEQPPGATS